MKVYNRTICRFFYVIGLFLILSSCAKEKTYYADEPNPNKKVDICRIGNEVIRLSVTHNAHGDGKIYLSSTTEFSATPYQTTSYEYSWASNLNSQQWLYPFYLEKLGENKYYYYVATSYGEKIASGSFSKKDIADILKVKKMTVSSNNVLLILSVPVWFLNIINYTVPSNSQAYPAPGSLDYINHEISYNFYFDDPSSITELKLSFKTKEGYYFYTSINSKAE